MISKETGKNGNLFPICAAGIKMQSHRRLTFLRSNLQRRVGDRPFRSAIPRIYRGLASARARLLSTAAILSSGVLSSPGLAANLSRRRARGAGGKKNFLTLFFRARARARGREIEPDCIEKRGRSASIVPNYRCTALCCSGINFVSQPPVYPTAPRPFFRDSDSHVRAFGRLARDISPSFFGIGRARFAARAAICRGATRKCLKRTRFKHRDTRHEFRATVRREG